MKDKMLKEMFRESESLLCIDADRKKKTLYLLSKEINKKKILLYDKRIIIKNQFIYMDKTSLIGSVVSSFFIIMLIFLFNKLGWENHEVIASNCVFSSLLSVISLVGVSNVFTTSLPELEESCYFNVKQVVAFQMICQGIISLTVLLIVTIWVGFEWKIMFFQIGLYVFVPFVLTQCCCLLSFLTKAGRQSSYMIFVIGVFTCLIFGIAAMIPQIYSASAISIWMIAFIIGIVMLSVQIRILFNEIRKGEILCTS